MKRLVYLIIISLALITLSCTDKHNLEIPVPNDITLNEIKVNDFSYVIPNGGGFNSDVVHFNTKKNADGTFSGFAYSNMNNRSFTWTATKMAIDSNVFSVYTSKYNLTGTFAVASVKNDDAFFILDKPYIIEHILVANTTYGYLGMNYGDVYGTILAPVQNPNIKMVVKSIWYSNVSGGIKKMTDADKDYFKLIIDGYKGGVRTKTVEFFLCSKKYDPANPTFSYLVNDWFKCNLKGLGEVDKVVFHMDSSDKIAGVMRTPAYFCLDGIRLKR